MTQNSKQELLKNLDNAEVLLDEKDGKHHAIMILVRKYIQNNTNVNIALLKRELDEYKMEPEKLKMLGKDILW